jgi:hypothetical protein
MSLTPKVKFLEHKKIPKLNKFCKFIEKILKGTYKTGDKFIGIILKTFSRASIKTKNGYFSKRGLLFMAFKSFIFG